MTATMVKAGVFGNARMAALKSDMGVQITASRVPGDLHGSARDRHAAMTGRRTSASRIRDYTFPDMRRTRCDGRASAGRLVSLPRFERRFALEPLDQVQRALYFDRDRG